jgi:hypothetical protein
VIRGDLVSQIEVEVVSSVVCGLTDNHSDKHEQPKQYQQQERQEH